MRPGTPGRIFGALGLLAAIGPFTFDLYLPAMPAMATDLGASASQIQLTLTASLAGLAVGQLVWGPLSDTFGRRRPLLLGLTIYTVASVLCAIAPNVLALDAARLVQGVAGGAGVVIGRAVVRDLFDGAAVARFFSRLMLISGLAPILAPLAGSQLLHVTSWRGIFWVLAGIGAALFTLVATGLPETLPPGRRHSGGLRATGRACRALARDRHFVAMAVTVGLSSMVLFGYIAGSSFVFQDVYGVSPGTYALIFAINATGLMAGAQLNARLLHRFRPDQLFRTGFTVLAAAGCAFVGTALAGGVGLIGAVVPLFTILTALGLVLPNSTALALERHRDSSGTASALLGTLQYAMGATAAPLAGLGGSGSALPMALGIAVAATAGLALALRTARPA